MIAIRALSCFKQHIHRQPLTIALPSHLLLFHFVGAYVQLVDLVAGYDLKVQAVMSFHACGCNVGDSCTITLPEWVLRVGEKNKDVYYTDRSGKRDEEYLSLGCAGRTSGGGVSVGAVFVRAAEASGRFL